MDSLRFSDEIINIGDDDVDIIYEFNDFLDTILEK
jgi:hypothetical protein